AQDHVEQRHLSDRSAKLARSRTRPPPLASPTEAPYDRQCEVAMAKTGDMDRRRFLGAVGFGGAVLAGAGVLRAQPMRRPSVARRFQPNAPAPSTTELFGDLKAGATLDRWRIVEIHPVTGGAIPVIMTTDGSDRFQVDVLRRDDAGPKSVATTRSL